MTKPFDLGRDPQDSAAIRLSEIEALFEQVREGLAIAIAEIGSPTAEMPKALRKRLDDLVDAHLKILTAEDAHYARTGDTPEDAIDYDAMRADIGRQLDRIRDTLAATPVS